MKTCLVYGLSSWLVSITETGCVLCEVRTEAEGTYFAIETLCFCEVRVEDDETVEHHVSSLFNRNRRVSTFKRYRITSSY
jgi:hypothetical protein